MEVSVAQADLTSAFTPLHSVAVADMFTPTSVDLYIRGQGGAVNPHAYISEVYNLFTLSCTTPPADGTPDVINNVLL